ncbi:hypothetical protein BH20CHL4_BH20CHL4_01980 [soil metagenome]
MSDSSQDQQSMRFVARADMWPGQINAGYPGAQFVARARLSVGQVPVAAYFSESVTDEVWGLLITTGGAAAEDRMVMVTADDGREFSATLEHVELLDGDPPGVLAAARYWELPPLYVNQLKLALQACGVAVEDEEPRDDGNLG